MKVYWTVEARIRLLEIQTYLGTTSPEAARRLAARLLRRSRNLSIPPLLGRRLPEYPDEDLREFLERPFRIIYRVTSEQIEVVTIKHCRQRLPRESRNLSPS